MQTKDSVTTAVFNIAGKREGLQFEIDGLDDFVQVRVKEVPVWMSEQRRPEITVSRLKKLRIILDSFLVGQDDLEIIVRGKKVYPCECNDDESYASLDSFPEEKSTSRECIVETVEPESSSKAFEPEEVSVQTDLVLGGSDLSDYSAESGNWSEYEPCSEASSKASLNPNVDAWRLCNLHLETQRNLVSVRGAWGKQLLDSPLQALIDVSIRNMYLSLARQRPLKSSVKRQASSEARVKREASSESSVVPVTDSRDVMRRSIVARLQRELSPVPLEELYREAVHPLVQESLLLLSRAGTSAPPSPVTSLTTVYPPLVTDPSHWL